MTTTTDRTWAVRVEAKGLEDVVTGPLTRDEADALLGIYLSRDLTESIEDEAPSRRRITCEEFDPYDPAVESVIPEGEERASWLATAFMALIGAVALYFAFHTYHLNLSAPRAKDVPIAAWLAFIGAAAVLMTIGAIVGAAWDGLMRRWARSSRRRRLATEVTS
jgi:hypothetical protein